MPIVRATACAAKKPTLLIVISLLISSGSRQIRAFSEISADKELQSKAFSRMNCLSLAIFINSFHPFNAEVFAPYLLSG